MILHLLGDDKFSDYVVEQFDSIDSKKNKYVILTHTNIASIDYVKKKDRCEIVSQTSNEFVLLCKSLTTFNAIIFHNISTPAHSQLIECMPPTVKVAWIFWGFEVYGRKKFARKYLGKYTRMLHDKNNLKQYVKKNLKHLFEKSTYNTTYEVPIGVFKRVDYCLTDVYEDFLFAQKSLKTNFKHAWYNYYSIEETLGPLKDSWVNGSNILLGNSASIPNNHIEAFALLKRFDLTNKKVIVPLSYGDKYYADIILKKGKKYVGDSFHPITEFMERDAYNAILISCNVAIMNHYRHQAMGNIITALWLGARVYVNHRSTTYICLKRLGVNIYSVEKDLTPKNKLALAPLEQEKVNHNRQILMQVYGKNNSILKIKQLSEELNK